MADRVAEMFSVLHDRQPTDAERMWLHRCKDALKFKDNDALWSVLLATNLQFALYRAIPTEIEAVGKIAAENMQRALGDLKSTADATMRAAAERTTAELAKAVATAADKVATDTARAGMLRWACGAVVGAVVLLLVVLVGGKRYGDVEFARGQEVGRAQGYAAATDEEAAAAWANTAEGNLAHKLAQAGSLQLLATCSGKGWRLERGVCTPHSYSAPPKDGGEPIDWIMGWLVPPVTAVTQRAAD